MKNNKIKSLFLGLAMLCAMPALAQNKVVTGTVVDDLGEPVIGATVRVQGTKTATVTDFDGNYKIEVPKGGKVIVSYIGFKDVPTTGGKVQLAAASNDLEEVVVVGYGTQKKAHLTGSVASVDVNDIQDIANGNLASSLSGLVNGLGVTGGESRPGEAAKINIRDTNSFGDIGSNAQQPLFVIDGYIYPNSVKVGNDPDKNLGAEAFNNLDPSEIESISVLKDASAAVYGARAANGVILVTTKKGKMGAPSISYSGTFGFADEVSRPKMLSAYQWGRLYNMSVVADPSSTYNKLTDLYQYDELEAMRSLNYDLLDKYWKTAFTHRHSVNLSGATDKVNYFASVSYFDQNGNLGKLEYDRWNFRAGIDVKISKWLTANLTVSGDYGTKDQPLVELASGNEKDYNLLLTRPRYIPEEVDGYPIAAYGISNEQRSAFQNYSFITLQNNGDYKRNMNSNLNIHGSLSYDFGWSKIFKGLKLNLSYSKSINSDKNNAYGSRFNYYYMTPRFGSGGHLYTPVDGVDDPDYQLIKREQQNGYYLSRDMTRTDNYQINFTAQYQRKFGDHDISGLFSIEKSEAESEYLYGYVSQPYDFTTQQSSSAIADTKIVTFTRSVSGSLSYIARLNYSYLNRYLFEFLFRADSSTKFSPENRWGYFQSLSFGWVVSEEPWFRKAKAFQWIDFLKLRASWGLTGRDNTDPWQWMQTYSQNQKGGVVFGTSSGQSTNNPIIIDDKTAAVNKDVTWDKSYKTNIGLDLQILNRRLAMNVDFYYEKNRDMLMRWAKAVPTTVGTRSAAQNVGEMNNWGWEFGLTWRDKIGKDFKYKVNLNTGFSGNEVLNMDWETQYLYRQITYGRRSDYATGWGMQCIGMFRSYQEINEYFDTYLKQADGSDGLYCGLTRDRVRPGMLIYKDIRGAYDEATGTYAGPDGIVDLENDQVQLSCRPNHYNMSLNLSAEWKGISLTAQFSAAWGGYTTLPGYALKPAVGNSAATLEYANMPSFWDYNNVFAYQTVTDDEGNVLVQENRDAYYPVLASGGDFQKVNSAESSFWRISSARFTLNRLTIAYSIPKKWLTKVAFIKSVRINITGQNLINFYNPYPDSFTSPMAGTYGSYPNLRKWTIGVNLSF